MSLFLYAATALVDGSPVGCFLLAENPDEASATAMDRLPKGGKLTHLVKFCEADLGTLKRNGLLRCCPPEDGLRFTSKALISIIEAQQRTNNLLLSVVRNLQAIVGEVCSKLGLRQFTFTIIDGSGVEYRHECLAKDYQAALDQAEQLLDRTGPNSKLRNLTELER